MWFSRKVFSWGAGNDPGPVTTSVDGAQFFCISYLLFFVSHIFLYLIFFCISYVIFFVSHIFLVSHLFCLPHMFFCISFFCISYFFCFLYVCFFVSQIFFLYLVHFFLYLICFFLVSQRFFLCISKLVLGIGFACESLFSSNTNKHILVFAIYIGIILHRRGRCTNLILLRL